MDPRGMMPPMPGPGEMPPMREQQRDMPEAMAGQPGGRPDIQPATRPPLTEAYGRMAPPPEGDRGYAMPPSAEPQPPVTGQYGRGWPQYRAPWQYGPGYMPGYMHRPQYGYPYAPVPRQDQDIPPPSAYPGGSSAPQ